MHIVFYSVYFFSDNQSLKPLRLKPLKLKSVKALLRESRFKRDAWERYNIGYYLAQTNIDTIWIHVVWKTSQATLFAIKPNSLEPDLGVSPTNNNLFASRSFSKSQPALIIYNPPPFSLCKASRLNYNPPPTFNCIIGSILAYDCFRTNIRCFRTYTNDASVLKD